MQNLLLIAVFGAAGAVSRYGLGSWIQRYCGDWFPLGTLVVNVAGCFLLGLLAGLSTHAVSHDFKNGLSAGFLGAFTTFSTFGFETVTYLEKGHLAVAAGSVAANVVLGLLAAWAGLLVARSITATN